MSDSEPDPTANGGETADREHSEVPGDAQGVPVPNEHAVEGTSERRRAVDGVFTYPESPDPHPTEAGTRDEDSAN